MVFFISTRIGLAKLGNIVSSYVSWVVKLEGSKHKCFTAPVAKRGNIVSENKGSRIRIKITNC